MTQLGPDEEHMLFAVAGGSGVTFISESRSKVLRHPDVRYRRLWEHGPSTHLQLAWLPERVSPALQELIGLAERWPPGGD